MPNEIITGHRRFTWWVELLNLSDVPLGRLDGVKSCECRFNVNAKIRGGGSLTYSGPRVDWLRHRLQPWIEITDGTRTDRRPLGVFIPAAPGTRYSATGSEVELELYDKTDLLDKDRVENAYSAPAGVIVTDFVRSILLAMGESQVAITDSTETLRNPMVWEAGTSKLRIINDLLAAINYFAIWCDGYGVFRADPYRRPQQRAVELELIDGDNCIYAPEFSHDFDAYDVPNKVACTSDSNGDKPALTAVATNVDPANPYSYPARGRWIVRVENSVEASSQAVLQGIADRYLIEGQQVGSKYAIKHAAVPLELNDVVRFVRAAEGIDIAGVVQSMQYQLEVDALVQTLIREVTE